MPTTPTNLRSPAASDRVIRVVAAIALLAVAVLLPARANSEAPEITGAALLARLADPVAALTPLPQGARVVQFSSHDRQGGNIDGGSYHAWSETQQPPTYLRREAEGVVLLDARKPGCLTRMWFTALNPGGTDGDLTPWGNLRMHFDGETTPRVDVAAADFFAGKIPGFPQPLVGNFESSSGGNFSYVPFCYASSLKVIATQTPSSGFGWHQLTVLEVPDGTQVETFDPEAFNGEAAAEALSTAGAAPQNAPDLVVETSVEAGDSVALATLLGAGSVRYSRFTIVPFDIETLRSLELSAAADDSTTPQIVVPLAPLFGDGLAIREIHTPAFGMDPTTGTGYFALPIPFEDGLEISLAAGRPADIHFEAWTGAPLPGGGTLFGEHRVETTLRGSDYTVLGDSGSGRFAAWVLDIEGGDLSSQQWFMEGDERVYVDGSSSPAIYGTGTEDTFNGGFYYNRGAFTLPTHGAGPALSTPNWGAAQSQYRVFGTDGVRWSSGVHFGMEHGGGDEGVVQVANTTFSYRDTPGLARTGSVTIGNAASEHAHALSGTFERRALTAYFEGDRDGNIPVSTFVIGGLFYRAPPPEISPEGVAANGIAFTKPVSVTFPIEAGNRGVLLRRLLDAGGKAPSEIAVTVDGIPAGTWWLPQTNPVKRWLEDDFELPAALTAGKTSIRVTLTPMGTAAETAYSLEAYSRI